MNRTARKRVFATGSLRCEADTAVGGVTDSSGSDTCVVQAAAKGLAGAAKASFVKKCTTDAVTTSKTTCDAQAAEKKLAGAAKTSFTKKCVTDMTLDGQATCNAVADDKKLAGAARESNVTKCVKDLVES